MGEHQKEKGLKVLSFIEELGHVLGYYVIREKKMFPNMRTSSILDVTWRRSEREPFPLFIFEVESTPNKSTSDNALKVFGRQTKKFRKPLYFFHVFVEQILETERVEYIETNFDKHNYGAYILSDEAAPLQLVTDILDQHLRVEPSIYLGTLIEFLETNEYLAVSSQLILEWLVEGGYDQFEDSNFLVEAQDIIIVNNYSSVRAFYLSYLPRFLTYSPPPPQEYDSISIDEFAGLIHRALLVITGNTPKSRQVFQELLNIENSWDIWSGWKLHLGLSNDHDEMALSEFPQILTLLSLAFESTIFARHYSQSLKKVVLEAQSGGRDFYPQGLVWLLIASQLAGDQESYEFARMTINEHGGIPKDLVTQLPTFVSEADERMDGATNCDQVPTYENWNFWFEDYRKMEEVDLLYVIVHGFLSYLTNFDKSRSVFARYCLGRSLHIA
jgi:hypothetical protein